MNKQTQKYRSKGVILMLLGAILFATKAIFVKLAYQYDVSSISLLALRMGFALPFFVAIGFWESRRNPNKQSLSLPQILNVMGLGVIGYYMASYLDFMGLQYLSAGIERLILFVYPTLVLIMGWILLNRPVKRIQWLATIITYIGMAIALSSANFGTQDGFWWGAILVFGSAFTFSLYVVFSGELAPKYGSIRFTSIAMIAAAIVVIIHAIVSGAQITGLDSTIYLYGFSIAIIATVIPSYLVTEGIKRIGAGDAAILGAIGPLATIILEYLVLNESLDYMQWVGAFFIISGVIIIGRNKNQ